VIQKNGLIGSTRLLNVCFVAPSTLNSRRS
jgi:hypothetical protein